MSIAAAMVYVEANEAPESRVRLATTQSPLKKDSAGAGQLLRLAKDQGADLIVAGAYGHSRFGEWVFAGTTREFLASSHISCLISH